MLEQAVGRLLMIGLEQGAAACSEMTSNPDVGAVIGRFSRPFRSLMPVWVSCVVFLLASFMCLFAHAQIPPQASEPVPAGRVLTYSTFLGGLNSWSQITAMSLDPTGNIYLAGSTRANDFPLVRAAQTNQASGFIAKFDPTGLRLLFSTFFGGQETFPAAIAVDALGNAYITGIVFGSDLPVTPGVVQRSPPSATNAMSFVAKIDTVNSRLVYSTYLGGSGETVAGAIALDAAGDTLLTGFSNAGFPTTSGAMEANGTGGAFLAKLSAQADKLLYSTYLGGNSGARAHALALDASGNVFITGEAGVGFPTTAGAFQRSLNGHGCFVAKLKPALSTLIYSTFLGPGVSPNPFILTGESCLAIAVDSTGNAYVTGSTSSANFPVTPGAFQTQFKGTTRCRELSCLHAFTTPNVFVSKLNATGGALLYSTLIGGAGGPIGGDGAGTIALDESGNVWVTGSTVSSDFPLAGPLQVQADKTLRVSLWDPSEVFVSLLNADGSVLRFSTYLGSQGFDIGRSIALDGSGRVWVAGSAEGDFPTTTNAYERQATPATFAGDTPSGFLARLEPGNPLAPLLSAVSPMALAIGNTRVPLTLYGSNFTQQSVALIGGSDRATQFVSATRLLVTLTAADVANVGPRFVRIQNRTQDGAISGVSVNVRFDVLEAVGQIDLEVVDINGKPVPGAQVSGAAPAALTVGEDGKLALNLAPISPFYFMQVTAPGYQRASFSVFAWPGQETAVQIVLVPNGTGTAKTIDIFRQNFDTGIDLKPGQTLILYVQRSGYSADGILGCIASADSLLPGGKCEAAVARIGSAPWFYVGPAFAGPIATAGRLYLGQNSPLSTSSSIVVSATIIVLDRAICIAEPSITTALNPGFYIAEVRTPPGAREGYWGMEVLAQKGILSGGFNLGGSVQETGATAGFGAFYVPYRQTVRMNLNTQVLPGAEASKFSVAVRLLDSSRRLVGAEERAVGSLQFERTVDAGFYIVEVQAAAGAPRATFQLGLSAEAFSGGVDVGGFVTAGLVGFGAFYIPEMQEVKIRTLGLPNYSGVGASCLTITLLDANRAVVRSAP